jgi:hypothetical protein
MTLLIGSNTTTPSAHDPVDWERLVADAPVAAVAGLTSWLRCDFGFSGGGSGTEGTGAGVEFLSMLGPARFVAMSDTGPQLFDDASGYNDRPYIRFNAAGRNGRLYDASESNLIPAGASFTVAYVAKDAGGSSTAYIGTDVASPDYFQIQHASTGVVRVQMRNSSGNVFTGSAPGDTDPHFGLFSYDASDGSYAFRVNGASIASGTTAHTVAAANMTIGTAGAAGSPTFRGDFYEALTFSRPLHRTADEADLAALENYVSALYGMF